MKNINKLGLLIGMGLMMTVGTMKARGLVTLVSGSPTDVAELAKLLGKGVYRIDDGRGRQS